MNVTVAPPAAREEDADPAAASLDALFPSPEEAKRRAGETGWPEAPPVAPDPAAQRAFGRDVLGPIFLQFCQRLWLAQLPLRDKDAILLYVARGGLRLGYLHRLYRARFARAAVLPEGDLMISRVAAAKGFLARDLEGVAPYLAHEFSTASLGFMLRCLVPSQDLPLTPALAYCPATTGAFIAAYRGPDLLGRRLRAYFAEQAELLPAYLAEATGGRKTPVLVDSGWSGGTQRLLMRHCPGQDWFGLYFGRWNYGRAPGPQFAAIHGLCVDSLEPGANRAGQALFAYHHLIEDPLEIPVPSVEGYRRVGHGEAWRAEPDVPAIPPGTLGPSDDEPLFAGIVEHFEAAGPDADVLAIERRAHASYRALRRMIWWPRPGELPRLMVRPRSADFGRTLAVPVVVRLPRPAGLRQRFRSIGYALWRPGQITIAFPGLHWAINGALYAYRRAPTGLRRALRRPAVLAFRIARRLAR